MEWQELALKIGDRAKEIIEQDRGEATNNGRLICFMTVHKSNPKLSWLPTKNDDPGKFKCCNCGEVYSISDHVKWMALDDNKKAYELLCEFAGEQPGQKTGFKKTTTIPLPKIEKKADNQTLTHFQSVEPISKRLGGKAKHYMQSRGISDETLKDYKVTSDENAIYFNYLVGGVVVKVKGRAIGDIANGRDKYKYTPKGGSNVLYGQHMKKETHRTLAICEGEIDALSLHEALVSMEWDSVILATSIPSGSSSFGWVKNSVDFIKSFEAVIIIPDNDEAGEKFVAKACSELMTMVKVRTATISGANDVNELLSCSGAKEVASIVANSKEYLSSHVEDLSKLPTDNNHYKYWKSGFFHLDKPLRGFREGLVTLFTGHSGDGKTTIFRQIILFNAGLKQRVGAMMGEESGKMLRDMIIFQRYFCQHRELFRMETDEFENTSYCATPKLYDMFNNEIHPYLSSFNCEQLSHADKLSRIYEWMRIESTIYGTGLFILDNMMKLEVGLGENVFSAQGDIIDSIKNMAETLRVHIIIIAHPKKESQIIGSDSVSGSKKLINTVDNFIIFQRFDTIDGAVADKLKSKVMSNAGSDNVTGFFKIGKNRVYGQLGFIPLRYIKEHNLIYSIDKDNIQRYGFSINAREYQPQEDY